MIRMLDKMAGGHFTLRPRRRGSPGPMRPAPVGDLIKHQIEK